MMRLVSAKTLSINIDPLSVNIGPLSINVDPLSVNMCSARMCRPTATPHAGRLLRWYVSTRVHAHDERGRELELRETNK
eukprot:9486166-Pyramimonas_sp.AAC.1